MNFNELTNNVSLLEAINALGFTAPSQIQEQSVPPIKAGRDILAQSQTGTGKTAAFAIPTIDGLDEEVETPQILVICPTRELAVQVADEFKKLTKFSHCSVAAVFGGEHIVKQIKELKKKPQIVVGTPGRMRDHIRRKTLKLDTIKYVVLDEADEMLKMGFAEEIQEVYDKIPGKTQNLMFSATVPKNVEKLASQYLENPEIIRIEPKTVASDTVKQSYMAVQKKYKKDVCKRVIDLKNPSKCIIFCNTKRMVDELVDFMQEKEYSVDRIHGDLKQEQRSKVMAQFNKGNIDILIATDIAGRGIDIKNVDLVINYDMPDEEDSYVHRIGRSGRAGKDGEAVSLVSSRDKGMLMDIQKYIKKEIEYVRVPSQAEVNQAKLYHLVSGCLEDKQDNSTKAEYSYVLNELKKLGYTSDQLVMALLEDRLKLAKDKEQDYNDYSFFNDNGDSGNNRKRGRGNGGRKRNSGGNRGNSRRSSGGSGRRSSGRRKEGSYGRKRKSNGSGKKRSVA